MTAEELAKLTPEEKRVLIAELCGWKDIYDGCNGPNGVRPDDNENGGDFLVPDYLNDLNAMHKVCETLDADQCSAFARALAKHHPTYCTAVLDRRDPLDDFWYETFVLVTATAIQRAHAFLVTMESRQITK